jgi:ATP-dependent DNA helicase RecG
MRPEILFPLFAPITSLKGVGPRIAPALERIAGPLVRDLLFLPPHSLVHRPRRTLAEAQPEETATVLVTVTDHLRPRSPQQPMRIRAGDGTGQLDLVYFGNSARGIEARLPIGARRWVSGRLERFGLDLQMVHPDHVVEEARLGDIPEIESVYPAGGGLAPRLVRRFVAAALGRAPDLPEWQDPAWRQGRGFPSWREAIRELHAPTAEADLSPASPARSRLAYDELLAHQLAMAQRRAHRRAGAARPLPASDLAGRIEAALPFRLTPDQTTSLQEIRTDLASGQRMSRLLQGDVGSGKTVVAMLALADAAAAGAQGALMAPTEILARQHFDTLSGPLEAQGLGVVLLTGRDRGASRREKLGRLADGSAAIAVGTHALFQDEVRFANLALSVIDEQHRFGVGERQRLLDKGEGVHLLAMSATPIPRTLELAAYGDLDVSRIIGKPPGRTPVATRAAPMTRVAEVEDRLVAAVLGGAQAFWICPLVSESELLDLKAAEKRAQDLQIRLGSQVGLVHGKLTPAEKDSVMADFAAGKVRVLVATTVVEVGVNVPNATIMVIEQAERFGLAQLHQLRGRVGRGRAESACVLLYDPPLSDTAQKRLDILRRSDDGFAIAETDLELRGGGDALGLRQSGFPDYVFVDPFVHRDLILAAGDDARLILARDPGFTTPRGEALKVLQALFDWRAETGLKGA